MGLIVLFVMFTADCNMAFETYSGWFPFPMSFYGYNGITKKCELYSSTIELFPFRKNKFKLPDICAETCVGE